MASQQQDDGLLASKENAWSSLVDEAYRNVDLLIEEMYLIPTPRTQGRQGYVRDTKTAYIQSFRPEIQCPEDQARIHYKSSIQRVTQIREKTELLFAKLEPLLARLRTDISPFFFPFQTRVSSTLKGPEYCTQPEKTFPFVWLAINEKCREYVGWSEVTWENFYSLVPVFAKRNEYTSWNEFYLHHANAFYLDHSSYQAPDVFPIEVRERMALERGHLYRYLTEGFSRFLRPSEYMLGLSGEKLLAPKLCELSTTLTANDRAILVAMLELDAGKHQPHSASTIVRVALYSGDKKRAFDNLIVNKLVDSKAGRAGGYWLTESGKLWAKYISENGATV